MLNFIVCQLPIEPAFVGQLCT